LRVLCYFAVGIQEVMGLGFRVLCHFAGGIQEVWG
jgi:hypothetical protein